MTDGMMLEAVRAGVMLFAGACVASALRGSSAARRHFAWSLTVFAVLMLPLLTVVLPAWRVSVPTAIAQLGRAADRLAPAPIADLSTTQSPDFRAAAASSTNGSAAKASAPSERDTKVLPSAPSSVGDAPVAARVTPVINWTLLVMAVWLTGFVAVLAYMMGGILGALRIARTADVCDGGHVSDMVSRLARETGIRRKVHVLLSRDAMPITWGYLRPVIVLPHAALAWSEARLETVLRHELAHIKRADAITQLAAQLVCALHWYNPLSWLAASRLRIEREHACDDALLAAGARASDYAEELLGLARTFGSRGDTAMAAFAMARPSSLRTRLVALLDETRTRAAVSRQFAVPSVIGLALVLVPLSRAVPVGKSSMMSVRQNRDAHTRTLQKLPPSPAASPQSPTSQMHVEVPPAGLVQNASPVAMTDVAYNTQSRPCVTSPGKNRSTNVTNNGDEYSYRIKYSSSGCKGEARFDGKLRYNDDYTRITGLGSDGSIVIDEEENGTRRHLKVLPAGDGLRYEWSINGREQPFDAAARQWFDDWTLMLFREMGFAANERANAMLRTRGVNGILSEVDLMTSDYVQATYLGVALEKGNLDNATRDRILDIVTRELESDYYMATAMEAATKGASLSATGRQSVIRAASKITSDYYKESVLAGLLKNNRLTPGEVTTLLHQARIIDSDYYRTTLLTSVADAYDMDGSMRSAYLTAVSDIESDYYRVEALKTLLARKQLQQEALADVIRASRKVASDYYQSELLLSIAHKYTLKGDALDAYRESMNQISSDYYRKSVAAALRSGN